MSTISKHGTRPSKKKRKVSKTTAKEKRDLDRERQLASNLFGGKPSGEPDPSVLVSGEEQGPLFQIDRNGAAGAESFEIGSASRDSEEIRGHSLNDAKSLHASGPAWVDEDDQELSVDVLATNRLRKLRTSKFEASASSLDGTELEKRLRNRYQQTAEASAKTDWAQVPKPEEKDDDDDDDGVKATVDQLRNSSAPLLRSSYGRLPPSVLGMVRCPDANQSDPNKAVVQAVHFHPGSDPFQPLLLTAGLDKTLRFFQVGMEKSEKVHGIHFPKLPIQSAAFLGSTGKVVVSGRRSFFYIYDTVGGNLDLVPKIVGREEKSLEKCFPSPDGRIIAFVGNDGYVILFDVATKRMITSLKMNGSVRAITFTPDSSQILASGSDGDVYCWDLKTRKCIERFSNNDGGITSFLGMSDNHLAVGSESGVVNLYSSRYEHQRGNQPRASSNTLLKSIMNLSTSADLVRFNGDGQIMAFSSRRERDSLKLMHVPTNTVFSNWPTSKTPLGYVWSLDFSPKSTFLAVGNDKGNCLLYSVKHYHDNEQ